MKCTKSPSTILFALSIVVLIATAYVSFAKTDIFGIAGTQLMEVSILLAVYGIYAQSCNCDISKKE